MKGTLKNISDTLNKIVIKIMNQDSSEVDTWIIQKEYKIFNYVWIKQ